MYVCADAFDGRELNPAWAGVTFIGMNLVTQPIYRSTAQHWISVNGWWALNGPFTWSGDRLPALTGWTNYTALGSSTGGRYGEYGATVRASTGTFAPYVYLKGYPPKSLPALTISKTTRFDYYCTGGWVQ